MKILTMALCATASLLCATVAQAQTSMPSDMQHYDSNGKGDLYINPHVDHKGQYAAIITAVVWNVPDGNVKAGLMLNEVDCPSNSIRMLRETVYNPSGAIILDTQVVTDWQGVAANSFNGDIASYACSH